MRRRARRRRRWQRRWRSGVLSLASLASLISLLTTGLRSSGRHASRPSYCGPAARAARGVTEAGPGALHQLAELLEQSCALRRALDGAGRQVARMLFAIQPESARDFARLGGGGQPDGGVRPLFGAAQDVSRE